MADTIETQAWRIVGTSVADAVTSIPRAQTSVLKRALELEQAKEGGGRSTLVASLRGELRRRGFLRRSAAQRGDADPAIVFLIGMGMFMVFMLALIWSAPADADEWGGAPALRFSWFPSAAECSSDGDLVRPALEQPIWRDGPTRVYGSLEHQSCLGERDEGDDRLGITLEVQL